MVGSQIGMKSIAVQQAGVVLEQLTAKNEYAWRSLVHELSGLQQGHPHEWVQHQRHHENCKNRAPVAPLVVQLAAKY